MKSKLEKILNEKIVSSDMLGGGCIADAKKIETENGKNYFVKKYSNPKLHTAEAKGLKELGKAKVIRIPEVIYYDDSILILEYIAQGKRKEKFSEIFGKRFAALHKVNADKFGFEEDNFCGSTVQKNTPQNYNWTDFYFTNRLLFQYKLAEQNNFITEELRTSFFRLEKIIEKILNNGNEKPSLLHGDLWAGNYIVDEKGEPCLIDPAVYYGNREADLAMTKIFGGFDSLFYNAYQEEFPLHEGWQYRENIYKLYHMFNHLNLFGTSYYNRVLELIRFYL